MAEQHVRYTGTDPTTAADGWSAERLTPASRLYGANGIRTGADGRIYVAQVAGSQISAINADNGEIETISPIGGDIVGPDDVAFDSRGNLYATEITEGRVSVRDPKGRTRVIQGEMPCANPITVYRDRLFAGECRPGGRIMELNLNGGAPRILLENAPMPNAMEVGPDGMLYIPMMAVNEIWKIPLERTPEGGEPEVVARDLGVPDAVKFDPQGFIVSTQVASGQVLRIDPQSGAQEVLATIAPGLDNLTFVGDRLFVSSITGQITEILEPGKTRALIPDGLQWPLGLAVAGNGELFIADGGFTFTLTPGGKPQLVGMLFSPGFPGYSRGVVSSGDGEWVVTTSNGDVARFRPARQESEILVSGFDRLMGVALVSSGAPVFAESGAGRLLLAESGNLEELATGLDRPMGVATDSSGNCYVAEGNAGCVTRVSGGKRDTVLDGLGEPHGIAVHDEQLFVMDVQSKELIALDLTSGARTTIASALPVGAPPGVEPKPLGPIGDLAGPMPNFTGLAVGSDGTLYVSADAEGSVLAVRRG